MVADGSILSQGGTAEDDRVFSILAEDDGSIVLAGVSRGAWGNSTTALTGDFAVVKLDDNGAEVWRWQVTLLWFVHKTYDDARKEKYNKYHELNTILWNEYTSCMPT